MLRGTGKARPVKVAMSASQVEDGQAKRHWTRTRRRKRGGQDELGHGVGIGRGMGMGIGKGRGRVGEASLEISVGASRCVRTGQFGETSTVAVATAAAAATRAESNERRAAMSDAAVLLFPTFLSRLGRLGWSPRSTVDRSEGGEGVAAACWVQCWVQFWVQCWRNLARRWI